MEWINVNDELPEYNKKVLISINTGQQQEYITTIGALFNEKSRTNWHAIGYPIGIHQQVIAWMPLPIYEKKNEMV